MTELDQLKSIWTGMEAKLDRNWQLNLHTLQTVNLDKARGKMNKLIWTKVSIMGIAMLFTSMFMAYSIGRWEVTHQAITGIIFGMWTFAILVTSIHELSLVASLDYSQPIPVLQKKLIEIKLLTIRYLRLSVWIFPLYFGFMILLFDLFFGVDIVAVGDVNWIIANLVFSVCIFIPAAIWMYKKLSAKNANKKWMNKLLGGNGSQIMDAVNFLEEIKTYEND